MLTFPQSLPKLTWSGHCLITCSSFLSSPCSEHHCLLAVVWTQGGSSFRTFILTPFFSILPLDSWMNVPLYYSCLTLNISQRSLYWPLYIKETFTVSLSPLTSFFLQYDYRKYFFTFLLVPSIIGICFLMAYVVSLITMSLVGVWHREGIYYQLNKEMLFFLAKI